MTDSKTVVEDRVSPKLNEENAQRLAAALTLLGKQYRERMAAGATQAGLAFARLVNRGGAHD